MSGVAPIFGDLSEGIPSPRPQPEARPRSRQLSTRKDMLAAGLVTLVLLSSIPAGGTPPLVTALIATALGAMGFIAGFAIPAPRKAAGHRPAALLLAGAALCAVGLLQAGLAYLPLQSTPLANRDLLLRPGSLSPDATLLAVLRAAAALLVLWLAQSVARNPTRARAAALALFAGIAVQAVWALVLLGPLGEGQNSAYPGAAVGTFVGRNALATYLGMGLVLGLALLPRDRRTPFLWIGLAVIGTALFATQSRMGLTATGAGAVVVLACRRPGWRASVSIALAAVLAGLFFGQAVAERSVWLASAGADRAALYVQVWEMIAARPLTGFGLDTFPLAFELFHHPPVSAEVVWDRAHSTYLTLWAEAGLLAGSLPPLAGMLALAMLYRRRTSAPAVAAIGALVLAGLHSLVDFSLEIPANLFLLLVIVGLGLGSAPAKG